MATKTFNTRVQLKYDTLANWTSNNPVLLSGEIALVSVPANQNPIKNAPAILMKIGDGSTAFNSLQWASALAADVASWAKADTKPEYDYSEIKNTPGEFSGKAENVSVEDTAGYFTGTNVETVLAEVGASLNSEKVSVTKDTSSSDYAAVYHVTWNGSNVGEAINVPKDMVVSSGEVVTNPTGQPAGTYLVLTLANATSDKIYINVSDLIEYVTAGDDTSTVHVDVSTDHKVTANVIVGSIGSTQLDTTTKASLAKADTAVQPGSLATIATSGNVNDAVQADGDYIILSCGSSTTLV